MNTAAGNDHRFAGAAEQLCCSCNVPWIGPGPPDVVDLLLEEACRIVVCLGLDVLGKCEEDGATGGGVEHHRECLRERLDHLLGAADPVPVAGHRLEGVRGGGSWVLEVLHLLQHGVDDAMLERVAGEQHHGHAVGMRGCCGGDHVGAAWADRGAGNHDPASPHRLAVGNGGQGHGLLVLAPVGGKLFLHRLESLGQTGHIAMTEDAEETGEDADLFTVDERFAAPAAT